MKTEDLIRTLAADTGAVVPSPERAFVRAMGAAVPLAALVFFSILGPRPDIGTAVETLRFLMKFVVTLTLLVTMAVATVRLARPTGHLTVWALLPAPALVLFLAVVEWLVLPPGTRLAAMLGQNAAICITAIPAIGLMPLGAFVVALRRAAPVRPALSGAIAGLMAGGLAATFYAAHCTDDSPLFVALWYSLAVALLGIIGAAAGHRFARW